MSSKPQAVRLGDVCRIKQGRYLAPSEMKESASGSHAVPVVGGNGVLGFVDRGTHDFGVPLVTCRGSRCGLMQWAEPPTWVSNNAMAVYFENDHGDNYFLYHYLRTQNFDDVTTGTAQPQITVSSLSQKTVLLPAAPAQEVIGRLMRLFEKKIQSNRRTAELLDGVASAIFRSWFIDFDPVKAKMAGKAPLGIDAETAALFPDSMGESEVGEIPTGWASEHLGSLARVVGGKQLSKEEFVDDGAVLVLGGAGAMGFTDKSNADGFVITIGRVGANCGRFVANNGPTWVNNNASRVVLAETGLEEWLLLALQNLDLEDIKKGAAQPFISNGDLLEKKIVLPTQGVLASFSSLVKPIFRLIENFESQNISLASLRDGLLPRLVSGELQISDEMLAA